MSGKLEEFREGSDQRWASIPSVRKGIVFSRFMQEIGESFRSLRDYREQGKDSQRFRNSENVRGKQLKCCIKNLLSLLLCSCPSKEIKLDFKPLIDFFVNLEVFVTDLLRCKTFF